MNINPKIFTASGPELEAYALFHDMVKIMKAADGIEPAGACCGRNTKQIINSFLNNKQKYVDFMENINTRLIKPLRKGVVYISPIKKMLNYDLMTDNEILLYVKKGYLPDNAFDWTEYDNKAQKPIAEEIPAMEPITEETPTEETPTEETPTEETPTVEPIAAETPVETPVEKPKRSAKRGQK